MRKRLGWAILVAGSSLAIALVFSTPRVIHPSSAPVAATSPDPYADKRAAIAEATPDYVVPHDVAVKDEITPTESDSALNIALSDDEVEAHLADHRFAVSNVVLDERGGYGDKNAGCLDARSCAIVTLVDYTAASTIVVEVDLADSRVTGISTQQGTLTAVGADEASRTYAVAMDDATIQTELNGRVAVPSGYPAAIQEAAGPCSENGKHRCVMVVFDVSPDRLRAFVDLTDERIDSWNWEQE